MIYAKPGGEFTAFLENAPSGLVGVLATRVNDGEGVPALARVTTGITEAVAGNYRLKRLAPEEPGDYLLIWDKDPDGLELTPDDVAIEELRVSRSAAPPESDNFRPSVDEVAQILTSRTFVKGSLVGSDSNLAGTFNDQTRPTADQVEGLIDQALTEIAPRVIDGEETTDSVYALARTAAARRAAILVLFSFFEEQLEDASSGYDELLQLYKDALVTLEGIQADTSTSARGLYSIPMRSDVADGYCATDLLP